MTESPDCWSSRPGEKIGTCVLQSVSLSGGFFLQGQQAGTARRAPYAVQCAQINLQLGDGAAERITVHAQFAGSFTLVAAVFLQNSADKPLFEFVYCLRIKNSAFMHLLNKSFEIVLHLSASLPNGLL